jgi:hypothetical protein
VEPDSRFRLKTVAGIFDVGSMHFTRCVKVILPFDVYRIAARVPHPEEMDTGLCSEQEANRDQVELDAGGKKIVTIRWSQEEVKTMKDFLKQNAPTSYFDIFPDERHEQLGKSSEGLR